MSEWIKLHAGVFTHPKTRRMAKRLSIPAAAVTGHLAALWTFTAEFAPDGDLSKYETEEVEIGAGWDGDDGAFVAAAVASGYLEEDGGRLSVHDWMDWGGKLVERKAAEAQRSADRRAAAQSTQDDRSTTAGRPLVDRERDRKRERKRAGAREPGGEGPRARAKSTDAPKRLSEYEWKIPSESASEAVNG